MFGIGLPEMLVIMAVALIVVGPEKLPDMARSVAKWMFELKKTVNQVKQSLADEDNLIDSVQSDLRKTGEDLKGKLLESDHFTVHEPGGPKNVEDGEEDDVIDMAPYQPETPESDAGEESGAAEENPEERDREHGPANGTQGSR